jgi:hypothetical protein
MWRTSRTLLFGLSISGLFVSLTALATTSPATSSGPKAEWMVLSEQAEGAMKAGRLEEAADLYGKAQKAAPREATPNRGACEVAMALEAKGSTKISSRGSCYRAFLFGGSAEDLRNEVASSLAPRQHPALDDLAGVSLMSEAATRKSPDLPWGYLARCDIARRLGSADVLEACLTDLKKVAPSHVATQLALATPGERVSLGRWALRWLLLLIAFGTPAHALIRRRRLQQRRAPMAEARAAAIVVAACSLLFAQPLRAAPIAAAAPAAPTAPAAAAVGGDGANGRPKEVRKDHLGNFKIDDANPEASVPALEVQQKSPLQFGYLIQDLATRAELAIKRGDHAAAARYFKAISKATPKAAYGPRKLCEELEVAGDVATAIKACRTALTLEGSTAGDYGRFVHVVLATRGPLPDLEHKELDAVVAHLGKEPNMATATAALRCQVALRFEDTAALRSCTEELEKADGKNPQTVSFAWALAVQTRNKAAAQKLIERGRELGMSDDSLAMMEQATARMERKRFAHLILLVAGGAVALVLLGVGLRWLARRRASGSGPGASALSVG